MIPKIIIFEQNENISFAAQEILNNRFYNFGGIKKTFNERK
jgi:hypothetical protein